MNGYKKRECALPAANHVHIHMPTIIVAKDTPRVLVGIVLGLLFSITLMSAVR